MVVRGGSFLYNGGMKKHSDSKLYKILIVMIILLIVQAACTTLDSAEPGNSASLENNEPAENEPEYSPAPLPTMTLSASVPTAEADEVPNPTQVVSIDLNTIYAEVIDNLPSGSALFNPAETMRMGEIYPVEVRVVPVTEEEIAADETVKATLTAGMDDTDVVIVIPLKVSTVMRAKLSGAAFTIFPLTEEEQIRTSGQTHLRWLWDVRPEEQGEQHLTLHLSVVVNAEGMGDKVHTTSEIRQVTVSENWLYLIQRFFGTNWEWVATGVLLPTLAWLWRKIRPKSGSAR